MPKMVLKRSKFGENTGATLRGRHLRKRDYLSQRLTFSIGSHTYKEAHSLLASSVSQPALVLQSEQFSERLPYSANKRRRWLIFSEDDTTGNFVNAPRCSRLR